MINNCKEIPTIVYDLEALAIIVIDANGKSWINSD